MTDFPYQTEIVGDYKDFDAIVNWCSKQWPHTQGQTWQVRQTNNFRIFIGRQVLPGQAAHKQKFGWIFNLSFSQEEDFLLYQITWT